MRFSICGIAWSDRSLASKTVESMVMVVIRVYVLACASNWVKWCVHKFTSIAKSSWRVASCWVMKRWTLLVVLNIIWSVSNHTLISHWIRVTCIVVCTIIEIKSHHFLIALISVQSCEGSYVIWSAETGCCRVTMEWLCSSI